MMTDAELAPYMDRIAEAILLDFADRPDDEMVPMGRLLIEMFNAEERGYDYPPDLADLYLTVGQVRQRSREMRAEIMGNPDFGVGKHWNDTPTEGDENERA